MNNKQIIVTQGSSIVLYQLFILDAEQDLLPFVIFLQKIMKFGGIIASLGLKTYF